MITGITQKLEHLYKLNMSKADLSKLPAVEKTLQALGELGFTKGYHLGLRKRINRRSSKESRTD